MLSLKIHSNPVYYVQRGRHRATIKLKCGVEEYTRVFTHNASRLVTECGYCTLKLHKILNPVKFSVYRPAGANWCEISPSSLQKWDMGPRKLQIFKTNFMKKISSRWGLSLERFKWNFQCLWTMRCVSFIGVIWIFLQGWRTWPTDRHTDRPRYLVCSIRPLSLDAMRPKNNCWFWAFFVISIYILEEKLKLSVP